MTNEKRNALESVIGDLVGSLFYYDRKEDDELTVEDMENLSDNDLQFICDTFEKAVKDLK